jgi:hypothetical protein
VPSNLSGLAPESCGEKGNSVAPSAHGTKKHLSSLSLSLSLSLSGSPLYAEQFGPGGRPDTHGAPRMRPVAPAARGEFTVPANRAGADFTPAPLHGRARA